jgi:hypothetical protein
MPFQDQWRKWNLIKSIATFKNSIYASVSSYFTLLKIQIIALLMQPSSNQLFTQLTANTLLALLHLAIIGCYSNQK